MFASFRRAFGSVKVHETRTLIHVEGIPADVMQRDLTRIWKTSKIAMHMFNTFGRSSFSFHKFFAMDIIYIIDTLIATRSGVSVRVLNNIRKELFENTWLKNTLPSPDSQGRLNFENTRRLKKQPLPHQREFMEVYSTNVDKLGLNGLLAAAAAGSGKAQPLTAMVKVPGGWKQMGDINVGDVVTAADGTPTKVIGVYPQGRKQTFTLRFRDGRSTTACAEHLWKVYCQDWTRYGNDGWRIINTAELLARINNGKQRLYVQLCQPEQDIDVDLPMDPYNLGVILGDGGISTHTVNITKGNPQLFSEFAVALPETMRLNQLPNESITQRVINVGKRRPNEYAVILKSLGLMGRTSLTKFIPEQYLHASAKQRLALLQGLLDTDGTVDDGTVSFSSSSYVLARQVQYLVRSLGGMAKMSHKETTYTYLGVKKNGNTSYRVTIRFPVPSTLFRLDAKRDKVNDNNQYAKYLKLQIKEVVVDKVTECQCIEVDHPEHLYVTDDFTVTHNTLLALSIAECVDADYIIVICPKNATQRVWEKTVVEEYVKPQSFWQAMYGKPYKGERILIAHYESLPKVIEIVKSGALKSDNITIVLDESHNLNEIKSQRTQLWIELCQLTKSKNIIPASGTPVKAMGAELIPLLKVLDPLFNDAVEERFKKIFGKDGNKGLEILKNRLGLVSYKIEKSALGLDKPIMKTLPIKMPTGDMFTLKAIKVVMEQFIKERVEYYKKRRSDDERFWERCIAAHENALKTSAQKAEYNKYKNTLKTVIKNPDPRYIGEEIAYTNIYEKRYFEPTLPREMIKQFRDVKSVIKYTQLKIQGECLGRVLGRKRIECHVDMVKHIDFVSVVESTMKKTVVFTSFVEALVAANEHCTTLDLKPLVVYGKTNNELASIVKRFEQDDALNPLIATYNSLSTAVPLVMADTMIMVNSPFRAYIEEQAISRIHRLGADTQTTVYRCHLDTGDQPNISTRSSEILAWSQAMVEEITGVKSPFAITESLENHSVDVTAMDDNQMFNSILSNHYARFGIDVALESDTYGLEQPTPGFKRW